MATQTRTATVYSKLQRHLDGDWAPGQKLPSERELAVQFGVSTVTVSRALADLVHEGVIYRVPGMGTFVSAKQSESPAPTVTQDASRGVVPITGVVTDLGSVDRGMSEYGRAVWRHLAVSEIERVVQAEGGRTIVLDLVGLSREEIGDEVEKLVSSGVNNLIVLGRTMLDHGDHLALGVMHAVRRVGRAIPVVWAEASDRLNWPFDSVRYDCRQGSLNAVQHLIDLGHRRIALLAPGATMMWANERIVGFHQAMELSGLPSSDDDVVRADDLSMAIDNYWPIVGRSAADRFLANRGDYTAAVCMNDSIGCQLIAAARECGISVPGDLSVTGFDDSLEARRMGLTSVQLENAAFGRTTALRAIECLRNPRAGVLTDTRLIPTLVVRSSTAPPPAR